MSWPQSTHVGGAVAIGASMAWMKQFCGPWEHMLSLQLCIMVVIIRGVPCHTAYVAREIWFYDELFMLPKGAANTNPNKISSLISFSYVSVCGAMRYMYHTNKTDVIRINTWFIQKFSELQLVVLKRFYHYYKFINQGL